MIKYLSSVLFIVFLLGQSSVEPKRNEVVSERHSNGLKKLVLVFEGEGLDEVLVAKYGFYENGLKSFIQSYKDNVLDGQSTEWYENGTKKSEIFYKSNQPSGELRMWHPNGQLRSIGNALNGKGTGEYKEFNDQGEIIRVEARFINDMQKAYDWADKVISRAGGTSVAELIYYRKP